MENPGIISHLSDLSISIFLRRICDSLRKMLAFLTTITSAYLNPLSANPIKWLNTLKQFVGRLLTNCLSVFGHFVNLALKGLRRLILHRFHSFLKNPRLVASKLSHPPKVIHAKSLC